MIDRFRRGGRDGRLLCDDFYEQSREHASRNREDNHGRAHSPTPLIDRNVGGTETLPCFTCRQGQAVCFSRAPSSRVPPNLPAHPKPAPKKKDGIPYEVKNAREWDPTRRLETALHLKALTIMSTMNRTWVNTRKFSEMSPLLLPDSACRQQTPPIRCTCFMVSFQVIPKPILMASPRVSFESTSTSQLKRQEMRVR